MFGILGHARVLFGKKQLVGGNPSIAAQEIGCVPLQLGKLPHDFIFTGQRIMLAGGQAVGLGIVAEMFEARIAFARFARRVGIDFIQVMYHRVHGRVQTVKIESVHAHFGGAGG